MTVTTQREECTATVGGRLLMSMELGRRQWKLGFTTGVGQRPRRRTLSTDAWDRLPEEIAAAKKRLQLPADAPVISCYEAGRDGFWIHRYLTGLGIENLVVDSSSIEVNRRARRAKTDRMDVEKLLAMLLRYTGGERTVWRIVRVPSEADEHRRHLHRELMTLKQDRTRVTNRIAGLLATVGVLVKVDAKLGVRLDQLLQWNGQPPARGAPSPPRSGVAEGGAPDDADPRPRRSAPSHDPREPRRSGQAGQTAPRATRHRQQRGVVIRHGALRLARVSQSPPSRWEYRVGGHPVSEWRLGS
jgi:hypothetical protein